MTFLEAMKVVVDGGRVRRALWEVPYNPDVTVSWGVLSIKGEDGKYHGWMISRDDMEAEDWEVWKGKSRAAAGA